MTNSANTSIICNRIKELREERNITQDELAQIINVKRQTINQWEHGERSLKTEAIIKLARFFGVTCDYLIGVSDYKSFQMADIGRDTGLKENVIKNIINLQKVSEPEKDYIITKFIRENNGKYNKKTINEKISSLENMRHEKLNILLSDEKFISILCGIIYLYIRKEEAENIQKVYEKLPDKIKNYHSLRYRYVPEDNEVENLIKELKKNISYENLAVEIYQWTKHINYLQDIDEIRTEIIDFLSAFEVRPNM